MIAETPASFDRRRTSAKSSLNSLKKMWACESMYMDSASREISMLHDTLILRGIQEDSEGAFNAEDKCADRCEIPYKFHVVIVEKIVDIEPHPQREANSGEHSRDSRIDHMNRDAIVAMDNGSEADKSEEHTSELQSRLHLV